MASAGLLDDTKQILDKTNALVLTIIGKEQAEKVETEAKTEEVKEEKTTPEEK